MKNSGFTLFLRVSVGRILGSSIPIVIALLALFSMSNKSQAQGCAMVCHDIRVSLDENCSALITYQMLLVDSVTACPGGTFTLQLEYLDGTPVPTSPYVTRNELGQIVGVVTGVTPTATNECWSFITVEDKIGPQMDCDTAYLNCWELVDYPGPTATDNCFHPWEITVESVGEIITPLNCNPNYVRQITRTWLATDGSGMTTTCDQVIFLERLDTSLVEFPINLMEATNNPILCTDDYDLNNDGVIDPEFAGVPTLNGVPMYPWDDIVCSVSVTFEDTPFPALNCKEKVMRVWKVSEWWCTDEVILTMPQLIEIVDETGPTITCPADMTFTTTIGTCDADIYLPPASATDDCSDIIRYDVIYPGGTLINSNGGLVNLPVGTHQVTYRVYDECYNSDECVMNVTVVDNTPPIAICDQYTAVALTINGKARVPAHVFDDGSHDECGIDRFEVRRMNASCGYDNYFRDHVEFSCCDIPNNPIMVVMRVYDLAGNYNECMVEVEVQDKIAPVISCPPNITVSCTYPFDMSNLDVFGSVVPLDSLQQLNDPLTDPREDIILNDTGNPYTTGPTNYGKDGYAYGTCGITITQTASEYIDQCGIGFIYRTFTATNNSGQSVSCSQTISFTDYTPFSENYITWPSDVTINGGCDEDVDPDQTGRPTWYGDDCELIGLSDPVDMVFNFNDPDNPACYKVLRQWKVIDWCNYNQNTGAGLWTHMQVIKVVNTEGPTVVCDDVSICSYDLNCANAFIPISMSTYDDCTDSLSLDIDYSIDLDNDGVFELSNTYNPFAAAGNSRTQADGTYPIGTHRIVWTVGDLCGNYTSCESFIEIVNCKKPSPLCYNGLSTDLMGIDTDGDNVFDWGMIDIQADFFDAGSSHPCYDDNDLVFSYSSDIYDNVRTFDCDSLGRRYVTIWVTSLSNGAQDYCNTFIDIDDNFEVCPDNVGGPTASITGNIDTEDGTGIPETQLDLEGSGGVYDMTDEEGYFEFREMPLNGSYVVNPDKNDHPLNGVTANDLSIIQRHIAGIQSLSTTYKWVAADANDDRQLDIRDVLDLRKLLLGIYDELPNNDVWTFLDANCPMPTSDPLTHVCEDVYYIPHFLTDMNNIDFVGVKIGDVDNDVSLDGLTGGSGRTGTEVAFSTENIDLSAGETYQIALRLENDDALNALQFSLKFDRSMIDITDISAGALDANKAAFSTKYANRGIITHVWASEGVQQFSSEDKLFVIEFTALADGELKEALNITSDVTTAAGFDQDGRRDVTLTIKDALVSTDASIFELFQNRPNPFANTTSIAFALPEAGQVSLTITDVAGRVILQSNGDFDKGYNEIQVDRSQLNASGIMYYRVETEANAATKKMILLD